MKKIWKDEEASTLVRVLFVILVSVLVVIIGVFSFVYTEDEPEPSDDRTWKISVEGDHYLIEIFELPRGEESLEELSWTILNLNRLVTTWEDPNCETLRMEGDLIDINYSAEDNGVASVTVYDKFYSGEPSGNPPESVNHTLCIVFFDDDSDGKASNGDYFWVRPIVNGGCAMEDYRFRLVNEKVGCAYGEMIFPPFP